MFYIYNPICLLKILDPQTQRRPRRAVFGAHRSMAMKMKNKFDKYWGHIEKMNLLIYLAVVLDPRFKLRYVEFAVMDMYEGSVGLALAQLIRSACYEMFLEYKMKHTDNTQDVVQLEARQLGNEWASDSTESRRRYTMVERFKRHTHGKEDLDIKNDLEKYLSEDSEVMKDGFDVLCWWKVNAPRFPILAQMARDILAVPISTVASESVFSTGGRVLDSFRSSLTPKIVQALICAQDWMRAKWTTNPVNIEENIKDVDKFDEDLSKLTNDSQTW